jgi:hypothetical protein
MKNELRVKIVDITQSAPYEKYLYKCITPAPFGKYRKRREYLDAAIPKGFHKKLLILNHEVVGQIEYAPAEVSGYPIKGENIIVMNCIWVLRRAKGHNFGKELLCDMIESEKDATGFATIALENHWTPWLKRNQMEKLGFKSLDSVEVVHKAKHTGHCFKIYLMWLPRTRNAKKPAWDKTEFLKGTDFCAAHPLYHSERSKLKEILDRC